MDNRIKLLLGILIALIICAMVLFTCRTSVEGFEEETDADYTQKYTKQIEDYLKAENKIKQLVEQFIEKNLATWPQNVDKTSIGKQMEALPDPSAYVDALKKQSELIDAKMLDNDVDAELIDKINSMTTLEDLKLPPREIKGINELKDDLKKAIENITLSSLSKFKERAIDLQKRLDEILLLIFKNMNKGFMQPADPATPEKIIEYEINKFAKPIWAPLQFVLGRLSKVMSLGPDGTQKYNENEAMGLAIKELTDKSKVNDIDKFYTLMSASKGSPSIGSETIQRLFSDPLSYLNLVLYMGGKMKEMAGKTGAIGEGFYGGAVFEGWAVYEGWEDVKKSGKCIPCKVEPEVQDIEGLKKRYIILKNSRKQFKEEVARLKESQAKAEEIEKKAMSGELMTEMIANRKE